MNGKNVDLTNKRTKPVAPLDAATLLLVDFKRKSPTVLMGKRHSRHSFMPEKYVFPGGKVEKFDQKMNVAGALDPVIEERLLKYTRNPSPVKARSFALAAIRETFEETGNMLGTKHYGAPEAIAGTSWTQFSSFGVFPRLDCVHFIARAITPPSYPKRYDTRFFLADASEIGHTIESIAGDDAEFTDLVWIPLEKASSLNIPSITERIIEEARERIDKKMSLYLPVPFFRQIRANYVRELI